MAKASKTSRILPPAPRPCDSCPYRRDVPSGVWDESEYAKLPRYDAATGEQPHGVFLCHRQDGRACAGWVAVHDMGECLALRLALAFDHLSGDELDAFLDYSTPVECWTSGAEAAAHGLAGLDSPSAEAVALMLKLRRNHDL